MRVGSIDKVVVVVGGRRRLLRNLPAHICDACGERFLDAASAATLEKATGIVRTRTRAA